MFGRREKRENYTHILTGQSNVAPELKKQRRQLRKYTLEVFLCLSC